MSQRLLSSPGRAGPLVALALVLAACSDEPEPVVRLLDRAAEGVLELGPDVRPARPLLDGAELAAADWRRLLRPTHGATEAERLRFAANSRAEDGGRVVLGNEQGSFATTIPFEGGETVCLEVDVLPSGLAGGGMARVTLVELSTAELPADDGQVGGVALRATSSAEISSAAPGGGPRTLAVTVATLAATRGLGVLLSVKRPAALEGGHAVFDRLRLFVAGDRDLAANRAGDLSQPLTWLVPEVARWEIELVSRPGLCVLPDTRGTLPVQVPLGGGRFEAFVGLVPDAAIASGAPVELSLALELEGGDAPAFAVTERLVTSDARGARWRRVAIDLPAWAAGRSGELGFAATSSGRALPVLATPRIVPPSPLRPGPNLVIVSLDTLRADRVGAYGYERPTTPNLDKLASQSLVFLDTWATSPYTLPSHVSLFTGQVPAVHGVEAPNQRIDRLRSPLLAQLLSDRGWATGAFTGGAMVLPDFGFARGFDRYGVADPGANLESERLLSVLDSVPGFSLELFQRNAAPAIRDWIARHREESFFLFVHTYAVHEFDPPRRHMEALGLTGAAAQRNQDYCAYLGNRQMPPPDARAHLGDLYDAGVRQADELLGELLRALDQLDLADDTLVVVVSDHGKELGEHGSVGHGHQLYEELLRIPLVLRVPGHAPARSTASLADVLPTVLEALDVAPGAPLQGRSLLGAPPAADRPLWAEVHNMASMSALRRGAHKSIHSPPDADVPFKSEVEWELFDLASDPAEQHAARPSAADRAALEELAATWAALRASLPSETGGETPLDAEARAHLEALGYAAALRAADQ